MTGTDPYVPGHGDASYDVQHYDLELGYRPDGNRLDGEATLTCTAVDDVVRLRLDLHQLRVARVSVNGRPPARYTHRDSGLAVWLDDPDPGRHRVRGQGEVLRPAGGADEQDPRRRRLGGAHRRRHRGGPAARCTDLVPLQRPARRQGDVRLRGHGARGLRGRDERRPGRLVAPQLGGDLALRAALPHGDLPRHLPDRAVRRRRAGRSGAAAGARARRRRGRRLRRRLRAPAGHDEVLRRPVRRLPLRRLHDGDHRRRPRDPTGVAVAVDLRSQLLRRLLAHHPAGRARDGAPVVRQRGDPAALAGHLAARGLRLLRRVAVVRGVRRRHRRRVGAPAPQEARPARARTWCSPTRGRS